MKLYAVVLCALSLCFSAAAAPIEVITHGEQTFSYELGTNSLHIRATGQSGLEQIYPTPIPYGSTVFATFPLTTPGPRRDGFLLTMYDLLAYGQRGDASVDVRIQDMSYGCTAGRMAECFAQDWVVSPMILGEPFQVVFAGGSTGAAMFEAAVTFWVLESDPSAGPLFDSDATPLSLYSPPPLTAVPEPATFVPCVLGVALSVLRKVRRKKS